MAMLKNKRVIDLHTLENAEFPQPAFSMLSDTPSVVGVRWCFSTWSVELLDQNPLYVFIWRVKMGVPQTPLLERIFIYKASILG